MNSKKLLSSPVNLEVELFRIIDIQKKNKEVERNKERSLYFLRRWLDEISP